MYLNGIFINDIMESDIINLKRNSIRENAKLEYKRQLILNDEKTKHRLELVRDVTAMYNSYGGCIIYGITEAKDENNKNTGYPEDFYNNSVENRDQTGSQIHNIIRANTDPAINGIIINFLTVENCNIIILGIPKRFGLPAMVTFDNCNNFYKRNQVGKYLMATNELNQMFMQNLQIKERAKTFVAGRIKDVLQGEIVPTLVKEGSCFLHIIPVSFLEENYIDIRSVKKHQEDLLNPINTDNSEMTGYNEGQFNVDGYITSGANSQNKIVSYVQLFRNGIIEHCTSLFAKSNPTSGIFLGQQFIMRFLFATINAFELYKKIEIQPPYLLYITINDLGNKKLHRYNSISFEGNFTNTEIKLPSIFFDRNDYLDEEVFNKMKPYFDVVWQAAGQRESLSYHEVLGRRNRN